MAPHTKSFGNSSCGGYLNLFIAVGLGFFGGLMFESVAGNATCLFKSPANHLATGKSNTYTADIVGRWPPEPV